MGVRTRIDRLFEDGFGDYRTDIAEGMARSFWVEAFIREYEGMLGEGSYTPGQDLEELPPPTPAAPRKFAEEQIAEVEKINGHSITELWRQACEAGGIPDNAADAELAWKFGWYLGMQILGHGVSWFDDHEKFPLELPHHEYYVRSDEEMALVRRKVAEIIRDKIPDS